MWMVAVWPGGIVTRVCVLEALVRRLGLMDGKKNSAIVMFSMIDGVVLRLWSLFGGEATYFMAGPMAPNILPWICFLFSLHLTAIVLGDSLSSNTTPVPPSNFASIGVH